MPSSFMIKRRKIGAGEPTFIVAEISANHRQKYSEAVRLIKAAKAAGADAVKLQTYTPDTITLDSHKSWFLVKGERTPASWKKQSLYELYQKGYMPWQWQPKLKKIAENLGLTLFSTPFDESAVDYLEKMRVPCYKIASYEVTHAPLLKKIARTRKPVIMSVGFANAREISEAVSLLRANGTKKLALLHCVTSYAVQPKLEELNLSVIFDLRSRFNVVSGFSDNNAGIVAPVLAVAAGASIIEKHFVLKKQSKSPDAGFSLGPREFKEMVKQIRETEKARGKIFYGPVNVAERYNIRFRRSIFTTRDIKKGEKFTVRNLRVVRPAFGLAPKHLDEVLGRRATKDIDKATPLRWNYIAK